MIYHSAPQLAWQHKSPAALTSRYMEKKEHVVKVISMKNGKHKTSLKISLVLPYTWKYKALIKPNYSLKNWKEKGRGNLTALSLEKKAKVRPEQREVRLSSIWPLFLHPKDKIQALPLYISNFKQLFGVELTHQTTYQLSLSLRASSGHPASCKLHH